MLILHTCMRTTSLQVVETVHVIPTTVYFTLTQIPPRQTTFYSAGTNFISDKTVIHRYNFKSLKSRQKLTPQAREEPAELISCVPIVGKWHTFQEKVRSSSSSVTRTSGPDCLVGE